MQTNLTRANALGAGAALALSAYAPWASAANAPYGKPETTSIKVGIPLDATSYMAVYVAQQSTWKDAGLDVQLLAFRGEAESEQALAGDSIDVNCGSLSGLISLIQAGAGAIGFYAGFNLAGFSWYGGPGVKTWNDARGKALGISTLGSTTDALTRYVLRKHGIDPEKDAHLIAVGNNINQYQALKANRTQIAMLSAPATWQAEADGFTLLGTQQKEVAPAWPEHIFAAKTKYIASNRNTLAALLRGYVAALRKAKADRSVVVSLLESRLKYTPELASKSYDEVMPTFDERGRLPEKSMNVFWDIAKSLGDVKAAMPESAILDRQFIDSFSSWAPK